MAALTIAAHSEMLLCRPLDDPEYRTVEAVLETRVFLGRRLSVPLKDLFIKCEQNDPAYQAFQLDNSVKLEQITAHWSWAGLTRALAKLKVDLTGLRILPPNLRERLQNLLYACGANLTEHRVMIQGPILNKDLNALSDQVENVARQLTERRTARTFQTLASQMRDLLSRRVKPLMKMQDELVYQLAALELHLQPIQRKANHTLAQLRDVQYHIDNQGEKIAQMKTKHYVDRLASYLDQWRAHVLTEMNSGASKCRPLWDILRGIKLLLCSHILGPLNGFWFASLICAITLLVCTPMAHNLASSYWVPIGKRGSVLLPSRQGSPDTVVMERETWRSPDPPPSMDSW